MKKLIQNDIIESINENLRVGNITLEDAERLRNLTQRLYNHIYSHYDGMEEINEMTDQSLILEFDILEQKYEKEKQKAVEEAVGEYKELIDVKDKEMQLLKEQIAQLEGKLNKLCQ